MCEQHKSGRGVGFPSLGRAHGTAQNATIKDICTVDREALGFRTSIYLVDNCNISVSDLIWPLSRMVEAFFRSGGS
jgi:hypothetical protein